MPMHRAAPSCRRRHGGALAVAARGRRSQRSGEETADAPLVGEFAMADELPQSLAAEKDSLAELLPDPANPPENLLDDCELCCRWGCCWGVWAV